ncbi:MAG TPA: endonuclease/exonuclease/phosphatase family protein, partial [Patescibacteria group bacterium]|nr:endonuclease/exonuclease/phosphatase family protein [Patescibacteria group bacterium]
MIDALVRRARWLLPPLIVALLLPLASPWLHGRGGRIAWLLDLAVHWQWLYAIAVVPVVMLCGWHDRRWWPLGLLALLPWWTAPPRLPTTTETAQLAPFRLISANVHLHTASPERLIAWTDAAPADVLVLLEVSPTYARALAEWSDYPHRVVAPGSDPFGIAVLSRHPFASQAILHDPRGIASIDVAIDTPQGCVALRALHPMPPISPGENVRRDLALAAALAAADRPEVPSVIAGDFNATPWSSGFAPFTAAGWRRATGLAPTWSVRGGGVIGIPIDHIVASR